MLTWRSWFLVRRTYASEVLKAQRTCMFEKYFSRLKTLRYIVNKMYIFGGCTVVWWLALSGYSSFLPLLKNMTL